VSRTVPREGMSYSTKENIEKLKIELAEWLKNELNLELNKEKTYITDLSKGKVKFLGFTFFKHIKKVSTVKNKIKRNGVIRIVNSRLKVNEKIFIGIDHEKVQNIMIGLQMLTKKNKYTRHVKRYCNLKSWEIVRKFKEKFEEFAYYYYPFLTNPSDLGFYYYIIR
jgi:hypothetical protein